MLTLFEAAAPADARPREAIAAARSFARGKAERGKQMQTAALSAHAAARDVDDQAAESAARAAGLATACAYIHATTTLGTAGHIVGAAVYAARARMLATDDWRAGEAELRWAVRHANPGVRALLRRIPHRPSGRGWLGPAIDRLHAELRRRR